MKPSTTLCPCCYDEQKHENQAGVKQCSFGKRRERIMTKYIRIRNAMKPYTKQLFEQAHNFGDPIIRTLFYEFPNDETCWNISDEYMYGSDMLVAPITEQFSTKRKVYLPKGATWQSTINGKIYEGGETVKVSARLTKFPYSCETAGIMTS